MMHELLLLLIGGQDADSSVGLDRSIKARVWAWHFGTPTTSKRTRVMFWPKRRTGKGSPMMTINWRGVIEMSRFSLDCCILQGCRFSVKGRNHPRPARSRIVRRGRGEHHLFHTTTDDGITIRKNCSILHSFNTMAPAPSTNPPQQQQNPLRVKIRLGNVQSEAKLLRFSPADGTLTMATLVRLVAAKLGVDMVNRSSSTFKVYLDGEALVEDVGEINDKDDLVLVVSSRGRGFDNDDTKGQTDKGDGNEKAGGVTAGADEAEEEEEEKEDVADAKPATQVKKKTKNAKTVRRRGRGSGKDNTGGKMEVEGNDKACEVIGAEEEETKRAVHAKKKKKTTTTTAATVVAAHEPSNFVGRRVAVYFQVSQREELYFGRVVEFIASNSNNDSSSNNKTRKTNEGEPNDCIGCSWKIVFDDNDVASNGPWRTNT
jgi:hypothetical protein